MIVNMVSLYTGGLIFGLMLYGVSNMVNFCTGVGACIAAAKLWDTHCLCSHCTHILFHAVVSWTKILVL